jgi:hypothetical protein
LEGAPVLVVGDSVAALEGPGQNIIIIIDFIN